MLTKRTSKPKFYTVPSYEHHVHPNYSPTSVAGRHWSRLFRSPSACSAATRRRVDTKRGRIPCSRRSPNDSLSEFVTEE